MSTKEMLHSAIDEMTDEETVALYALVKIIVKGKNQSLSKAEEAYNTITKLRKQGTSITDDNDREAYYQYLEDKYEGLD